MAEIGTEKMNQKWIQQKAVIQKLPYIARKKKTWVPQHVVNTQCLTSPSSHYNEAGIPVARISLVQVLTKNSLLFIHATILRINILFGVNIFLSKSILLERADTIVPIQVWYTMLTG